MMAGRVCSAIALLGGLLSASCGADGGVDDMSCSMSMSVAPSAPEVGDTVQLAAVVNRTGVSGVHSYSWSVRFGSETLATQNASADGAVITFLAGQAGVYSLALSGSVGQLGCSGDARDINVTVPGANLSSYRLRVTPEDGSAAPAQDLLVSIAGGSAEYALGSMSLSPGTVVDLAMVGPSAEPLAGYVRAQDLAPAEPPLYREAYSSDGQVTLLLSGTSHDLLLVPDDPTVAPALWSEITASSLGTELAVDSGILVSGMVTDPDGAPVEAARVMLEVAGVPSTVATTDAAGSYSLYARAGQGVAVHVVPQLGSGLPALELEPDGTSLTGSTTIDVAYDPSLSSRVISPVVRHRDGATAAEQARVTLIARPIASAGTITVAEVARIALGTVRATSSADASGQLAALTIPEAVYDAIIEPGPDAPATELARMQPVDLSTGNPSPTQLLLAAPAQYQGVVEDSDGQPVAGVIVRARPIGDFAAASSAGGQAVTATDGSFAVATVSADHEVVIDGHPVGRARLYVAGNSTPAGGQTELGTVTLPDTLSVTGRLTVAGGQLLPRAHLAFYCQSCGAAGQPALVGEGQTDAAGNFVVRLPDPGVSP